MNFIMKFIINLIYLATSYVGFNINKSSTKYLHLKCSNIHLKKNFMNDHLLITTINSLNVSRSRASFRLLIYITKIIIIDLENGVLTHKPITKYS